MKVVFPNIYQIIVKEDAICGIEVTLQETETDSYNEKMNHPNIEPKISNLKRLDVNDL